MQSVLLNVPNELLLEMKKSKKEFEEYARKKLAIELYKERKVSLGYCAQLAELTKEEFVLLLGENHISIFEFDDEEEFLEEYANA